MVTKSLKLKTETEKTNRMLEEAKTMKPAVESKPRPVTKTLDIGEELKSIVTGSSFYRMPSKLPISG